MWVEDKGLSLAVHYRQSPQKAEARRRILAATRNLKQVRVFGGKQVVNVVPDEAPHKGERWPPNAIACGATGSYTWVTTRMTRMPLPWMAILFRSASGESSGRCARYYLRTQAEIDKLLELLVLLGEPVKPSCGK